MPKKREAGLIEFDVDGVFNLHSPAAYRRLFGLTMKAAGVELPPEVLEQRIEFKWGSPIIDIYGELAKDHPGALKKALEYHSKNSVDIFDQITEPVPGSGELLERLLSDGYRLALNTASDSHVLFEVTLPKCGIEPRLFNGGIATAETLKALKPKPEPDIATMIMKNNNASPENTWMVGDSACDVLTANYSSIEPVVPLTGNLTGARASEYHVRYIIEDVTHLESVLEGRYEGVVNSVGRAGFKGYNMYASA